MSKFAIPFGMLFVEQDKFSTLESGPEPKYDPTEKLSYIVDETGERVPFVTWGWGVLGATGTGSHTKAEGEEEDTDIVPDRKFVMCATATMTKASAEATDDDRM